MHTVWAWFPPLSFAGFALVPSTIGWGLAVGSAATLVALPQIARAKRSARAKRLLLNDQFAGETEGTRDRSPSGPQQDAAAALASIPERILQLFEDPEALPVALPALLLFRSDDRGLLDATSHSQYTDPIRSLWEVLEGIEPRQRVALIDRTLRTLAASRPPQKTQLQQFFSELTAAAGPTHWQLQAWCRLGQDAVSGVRLPRRAKTAGLTKLLREMLELVSVVSVAAEDRGLAEYRFHRGWSYLELPPAGVLPAEVLAFSDLETALAKAAYTPARIRARICDACTLALTSGGSLDETQVVMLRLIRQRLGYPPYPALPGKVLV